MKDDGCRSITIGPCSIDIEPLLSGRVRVRLRGCQREHRPRGDKWEVIESAMAICWGRPGPEEYICDVEADPELIGLKVSEAMVCAQRSSEKWAEAVAAISNCELCIPLRQHLTGE